MQAARAGVEGGLLGNKWLQRFAIVALLLRPSLRSTAAPSVLLPTLSSKDQRRWAGGFALSTSVDETDDIRKLNEYSP